jgi:hypothetical protein
MLLHLFRWLLTSPPSRWGPVLVRHAEPVRQHPQVGKPPAAASPHHRDRNRDGGGRDSGAAVIARACLLAIAGLALLALALAAAGAGEIVLRNTWIRTHMNKVTISSPCRVDATHAQPNDAADDGDLHMACRCDEVTCRWWPDRQRRPAVMRRRQAKDRTGQDRGAWRIWIEHPSEAQRQSHVPVLKARTPTMFEIHPLTLFDGDSLHKVQVGYTNATTTFKHYEPRVQVERKGAFTSIAGALGLQLRGFKFKVAGTPSKLVTAGRRR